MKKILLVCSGLLFMIGLQAQTLPFAARATATANQYIRDAPSTSGGIITSIAPGQYIMAYAISSGWYKVYFADVSGIVVGYSLSGTGFLVPDLCHSYVTIQNTFTSGLNIRTGAGTSYAVVTIGSSTAKGWDGEEFVCTGNTQFSGGSTWYEIYLTNNCSSLTGWVSNGSGTGDNYLTYTSIGSVPATPASLTASPITCNSISLTWSASSGASTYDIYTCTGSLVGSSSSTNYAVTGLSPSTTYNYQIRASNSCGNSSFTLCQSTTTPSCPSSPTTPTGLIATATSCNTIALSWSASSGATDYDIASCSGSLITTVSGTTCTITGLSASTPYSYMVRANNSAGSSAYSSCEETTTPSCISIPTTPAGLTATATSCSTIVLSWSASPGASNYDISSCGGSLITTVSGTTYTITGLSASTPYSYMVRASNSVGSSPYSSCQGTTTPSCGSLLPDLSIVSPSANITNLVPNASTQITYTIQNGGSGSASSSTTSFFLSSASTYTPGDPWLKDDAVLSIAATGSSSPHNVLVTIPPGTAPGTYYITMISDAPSIVSESDETNNASFVAINVGVSLQCNTDDYPFRTSLGFSDASCQNNSCEGDPWNFCRDYCTSYVAWKVNQFHGVTSTSLSPASYPFNNYMFGSVSPIDCNSGASVNSKLGDACYWDDVCALNGIAVNNVPAVGAIAQWNPGDPGMTASGVGHVAFVNSVSGNVVCLSNYNGFNSSGAYVKCAFAYFQVDLSAPYSSTNRIPGRFIHVEADGLGAASVNHVTNIDSVTIFPNPSAGLINIKTSQFSGDGTIYIFDLFGKLIKSVPIDRSGQSEINLENQNTGLYIVQISLGSERVMKRVEIMR